MRIKKGSIVSRGFALIRCIFLKLLYKKQIGSKGIFFVGKDSKIFISDSGRIELGSRVHLSDYIELQSSGSLVIGNNTTVNSYSRLVAYESITVGSNCAIAQFVSILDHDHVYTFEEGVLQFKGYSTAPIIIGSNVWIGDKCTVVKGVTIGSNVVIGANSLVNSDIPDNCVAAGNPAKVIKYLK